MLCQLQISHHRKRSSFSLLSVSTLSALLRTAFFVVVALLKPPSSLILSVKRFCALPAGRAGTFTFSQVRSKSSAPVRRFYSQHPTVNPAHKGDDMAIRLVLTITASQGKGSEL